MIYIFHGSNPAKSRQLLHQALSQNPAPPIRLEAKNLDKNALNNLLSGSSLFGQDCPILIDNLFSLPPPSVTEITPLINRANRPVFLWQDKSLTPTQLKIFPQAKISKSDLNRQVFNLLNAIRPKNYLTFMKLFNQVVKEEPAELLYYLLRQRLRQNLTQESLPAYLDLINTDYLTKSGQSSLDPVQRIRAIFTRLLL